MTSYIEHIHEIDTFASIDDNKLTNKDGSEVIYSLMFLAEKIYVVVKGRT